MENDKKLNKGMLTIMLAVVILTGIGGWYWWKTQNCTSRISYTPALERNEQELRRAGLQGRTLDKGDYYRLGAKEYKTFNDAMSACRWN